MTNNKENDVLVVTGNKGSNLYIRLCTCKDFELNIYVPVLPIVP